MNRDIIVFMAGFPGAGKSHVIRFALNKLTDYDVNVINPKEYRRSEYDMFSEEEKREEDLCAWELSLDDLRDRLEEESKETIIFDTACATLRIMKKYFQLAEKHKRKIIYCFVHAPIATCKKRMSNRNINDKIWKEYANKFKESVPELMKLSDHSIIINNSGEDINVDELINLLKE